MTTIGDVLRQSELCTVFLRVLPFKDAMGIRVLSSQVDKAMQEVLYEDTLEMSVMLLNCRAGYERWLRYFGYDDRTPQKNVVARLQVVEPEATPFRTKALVWLGQKQLRRFVAALQEAVAPFPIAAENGGGGRAGVPRPSTELEGVTNFGPDNELGRLLHTLGGRRGAIECLVALLSHYTMLALFPSSDQHPTVTTARGLVQGRGVEDVLVLTTLGEGRFAHCLDLLNDLFVRISNRCVEYGGNLPNDIFEPLARLMEFHVKIHPATLPLLTSLITHKDLKLQVGRLPSLSKLSKLNPTVLSSAGAGASGGGQPQAKLTLFNATQCRVVAPMAKGAMRLHPELHQILETQLVKTQMTPHKKPNYNASQSAAVALELTFPTGSFEVACRGAHACILLALQEKTAAATAGGDDVGIAEDDILNALPVDNGDLRPANEQPHVMREYFSARKQLQHAKLIRVEKKEEEKEEEEGTVSRTYLRFNAEFDARANPRVSLLDSATRYPSVFPRITPDPTTDVQLRLQIDACLVRTMKKHRVLSYTALLDLVMQDFKTRGLDSHLSTRGIKIRIEDMIGREYLKRDPTDPKRLEYLA